MPYNNIVTAVPYVKVRHDSQSNVTYTPMLVSRLQGVNAQAMFAGTSEDIARLRNDELPNDFVEGETTFREAAKAAGVHEDIINMTPNFTIRTITPVFGQNDD
jgi:hypothetical protein